MKLWIENNLFNSVDKMISKRCRIQWFEKTNNLIKFNEIIESTSFLSIDSTFPQRCWHIINDIYENIKCGNPKCNNSKQFFSFSMGYTRDCSNKCAQLNPNTRSKIVNTNMKKYSVTHHLKLDTFLNKQKQTNIKKYGVENISQRQDIKDKRKVRMSEKKYQDNLRVGMIEKYGVDNIAKIPEIAKQRVATRFGMSVYEFENRLSGFAKYKSDVWSVTNTQNLKELDNYSNRGRAGVIGAYHLDHKISILDGYDNDIDITIIGSINNLHFITWEENLKKGSNSILPENFNRIEYSWLNN